MRKLKVSKIWISVFVLALIATGRSDPDKNPNLAKPGNPLVPPTVTSVTPPDASTLICPSTAIVSASFSKAMNPATINTTTFTVTAGGECPWHC